MVMLFFLPSLALSVSLIGLNLIIPALTIGGFMLCVCSSLSVVIFSSLVHQRRQKEGWKTFFLMTLVYLMAQFFALILSASMITIILGYLGLPAH